MPFRYRFLVRLPASRRACNPITITLHLEFGRSARTNGKEILAARLGGRLKYANSCLPGCPAPKFSELLPPYKFSARDEYFLLMHNTRGRCCTWWNVSSSFLARGMGDGARLNLFAALKYLFRKERPLPCVSGLTLSFAETFTSCFAPSKLH